MRRRRRGLTLAETIIAMTIFFLMLAAIGAIAGPILSGPSAGSAKSDTVASAAYGLDEIERDIRQSDVSGVFACTVAVTVTCSQPTSLTTTGYIAVLSAYDSAGVFQANSNGSASWQGFVVYSNPTSSGFLYRYYAPWQTPPSSYQSGAAAAVAAADSLPSGTTVTMPNLQSMSIGESSTSGELSLQFSTASGSGSTSNSTSYSTTVLARN